MKEDEHKLSLAKAHLVFEDYKKAFNTLKVSLPQKEKDAYHAKDKVRKNVKRSFGQRLPDPRRPARGLEEAGAAAAETA